MPISKKTVALAIAGVALLTGVAGGLYAGLRVRAARVRAALLGDDVIGDVPYTSEDFEKHVRSRRQNSDKR
jgi:hypothetical protein